MVQKSFSAILMAPLENLRGFASTRPPCVLFMVCLGVISVVLMTLAFIVKDNDLKKPDVEQDWNIFLENFADLEFCIQINASNTAMTGSPLRVPDIALPTTPSVETSSLFVPSQEHLRNYSVSMMVVIQPTPEFISIPHNLTFLTGTIAGSRIGLKGIGADEEISVSIQLPFVWNTTSCRGPIGHTCDVIHIYTCVLFQASNIVFPSGRSPDVCEGLNDTGVVQQSFVLAERPKTFLNRCHSKPLIQLNHKIDSTLTLMLSLSDRSLINLHLLHTSYFLFVMTITVLLYATIRGRPIKYKMIHSMSLPSASSVSTL